MSVSVIHPTTSAGLYKIKSKVILKAPRPGEKAAKIKKNLFGTVDPEENKRFVEEELSKIQERAKHTWDFNFVKERPIESSRFKWKAVGQQPTIFALTHAAHTRTPQLDSECTNSGDISDTESPEQLMDERADRANNYREPIKHFIDCDSVQTTTRNSIIKPTAFKPTSNNGCSSQIMTRSNNKPSRRLSTPSPTNKIHKQKSQEKRQPKITDFLPEKKKSASSSTKKMPSNDLTRPCSSKSYSQ